LIRSNISSEKFINHHTNTKKLSDKIYYDKNSKHAKHICRMSDHVLLLVKYH